MSGDSGKSCCLRKMAQGNLLVNVPDSYFSAESKGPLNGNQTTQFYCYECDLGFASGKLDEEDRTLERQLRAQGLRRTAAGRRCCRGIGPVLCGAELT